MIDLLVCIRCHRSPEEVLDTVESVEWSCDDSVTKVFCAVDGAPPIAGFLSKVMGKDRVFCSSVRWGWGAGLYGLMAETINHFEKVSPFCNFLSIDYDVLFLRQGADHALLSMIQGPEIGLIGRYKACDQNWATTFASDRDRILRLVGKIPKAYKPGEAVQGGAMLITGVMLAKMAARSMFHPPFSITKRFTALSDDHLLPLFCRVLGLEIKNAGKLIDCSWRRYKDPRKLKGDNPKIFHLDRATSGYMKLREHFRVERSKSYAVSAV